MCRMLSVAPGVPLAKRNERPLNKRHRGELRRRSSEEVTCTRQRLKCSDLKRALGHRCKRKDPRTRDRLCKNELVDRASAADT